MDDFQQKPRVKLAILSITAAGVRHRCRGWHHSDSGSVCHLCRAVLESRTPHSGRRQGTSDRPKEQRADPLLDFSRQQ
ncbi:hypothetical protein WJX77_011300 [Trebouxia sp. C0004]